MIAGYRSDALPEYTAYRDTGCSLTPRCLACPFARCRYDVPQGAQGIRRAVAGTLALSLYRDGKPIDEIAAVAGVSRRTVFRYLAAA